MDVVISKYWQNKIIFFNFHSAAELCYLQISANKCHGVLYVLPSVRTDLLINLKRTYFSWLEF